MFKTAVLLANFYGIWLNCCVSGSVTYLTAVHVPKYYDTMSQHLGPTLEKELDDILHLEFELELLI